MASFPNIVLTNAGLDMIAQAHDANPLIFTKMMLGSGILPQQTDTKSLTGLIEPKLDVPLTSIQFPTVGQVKLRFSLASINITEGFFVREVGIFAKLGEDGTEQLYAYTNAGNLTDYLDASDLPINELFDIDVVVGNATVLNILIEDEITATKKDLQEHNDDPTAHNDLLSKAVPAGTVIYFASQSPPENYLKCNGAEISRTDYANLFKVISNTFGDGDGSTTFNLPDLRGEFIRGWDNSRGIDTARVFGDNQVGTLQMVDVPSIGIFALSSKTTGDVIQCVKDIGADVITRSDYNGQVQTTYSGATGATTIDVGGSLGMAGATRPRNIALLACIKY